MILCLTSYALTDTNHEWLFILQFNNVGMCQILWCPKKHMHPYFTPFLSMRVRNCRLVSLHSLTTALMCLAYTVNTFTLHLVAVGLNRLKFSIGIKIRPGMTRPRKALQRGHLPMDEQDFMLKSLSNSEQHPVSIRQCELTLSPRQGSLVIHSSTMSK